MAVTNPYLGRRKADPLFDGNVSQLLVQDLEDPKFNDPDQDGMTVGQVRTKLLQLVSDITQCSDSPGEKAKILLSQNVANAVKLAYRLGTFNLPQAENSKSVRTDTRKK